MNISAGQTGSTCWFFSSLNIFLTSDNGLKILWQKLQEVYPTLKPRERAYFNSNINAPCPYKGSVKKTSSIYFWKFLNQYICAIGGPGRLIPKSGLNAYLTKNVKWRRNSTVESKGTSGAFPAEELPAILGHLGFRVGRDFRMLDFAAWRYKFKKAEWTNPIMMFRSTSEVRIPLTDLLLEKKGYDLTGAIVYVIPALNSNRRPHVWACTIRNGKGYICDSNFPTTQIECKWWNVDSLKRYFMSVEGPYRTNRAPVMGFDVIMYTRKEFTNKIAPSCQLPKQYHPLTSNNKAKLRELENIYGPNAGGYFVNTSEARKQFAPRLAAEAKRQYAARPFLNAAMLQSIVNEAGSFNNGMRIVSRKVRSEGFRVNQEGPNFKNFRRKLIAKFPVPVNKRMFNYLWKNSSSNNEFVNRLRNYANRAGKTVNENQVKAILATRAKTRAGTKRKRNAENERMYLVNNAEWRNSNGTNVTNKINASNWVRTNNNNVTRLVKSYTNATNVKTFKRKVANFNKERAKRARLL